ncbi:MAG: Fur family transcriptional regulator [Acidobacteriota bacterium]
MSKNTGERTRAGSGKPRDLQVGPRKGKMQGNQSSRPGAGSLEEAGNELAVRRQREKAVAFLEHLRNEGLKMTRERRLILEAICRLEGHFRPDDLLVYFKKTGVEISRATIYRTLEILTAAGLVIRENFKGGGAHYERAHKVQGHAHHDHLYCTSCGAILEFHDEEIERLQDQVCRRFGFVAHSHTHMISGLCRACRHGSAE